MHSPTIKSNPADLLGSVGSPTPSLEADFGVVPEIGPQLVPFQFAIH
jgi:hypothetical protein